MAKTDDKFSALRKTMSNAVTFLEKGRSIPASPTPFIIRADEYSTICAHAVSVLGALEKAARMVLEVPRLWQQFPELHAVEDFLRLPSTTSRTVDLARFDLAILKQGGVRMVESNAGCPGGLTTVGDINAAFAETAEYIETIASRVIAQRVDSKFYFVDYLASLIPEGAPKNIAFISSRHRPISTDLNRLTELADERGYTGIRCDVQDLNYNGKYLTFNGTAIHAAFLKFDVVVKPDGTVDLGIYGPDDDPTAPFYQALKDGAFAYVNSFLSQLLIESKRLLAILWDAEVRAVLTESEKAAIDALVSPTYSLAPSALEQFGGRRRLLLEKDQWVIKQVLETRGRGVHIGRYCTEKEWLEVVSSPVLDRCVAQEFVELDVQSVHNPVFEDPGYFDAYTDVGLYLLGGEAAGFLCRASRLPVVNVGKNGALRPTYVVRR